MNVSLSDAKAQLTDLARRAEAGEEVILTRRGRPAVRLVPIKSTAPDDDRRWDAIDAMRGVLKGKPGWEGVTAANVADFLYDERGLPA